MTNKSNTKRITVYIDNHIDKIRERVKSDTGVSMTYNQAFDYLINHYIKTTNMPRTTWVDVTKKPHEL